MKASCAAEKCHGYRTKMGYLCDTELTDPLTGDKYCTLPDSLVQRFSDQLGEPTRDASGKYRDEVVESTWQRLCADPATKSVQYENCPERLRYRAIRYAVGILLTTMFTSVSYVLVKGAPHFLQTAFLYNSTDAEIVLYVLQRVRAFVNKFPTLLRKYSGELKELETQFDAVKDDTIELGAYVQQLLAEVSQMQKEDQLANPSRYPYGTAVLDFFSQVVPKEHALQMLRGANMVCEDNGRLYEYCANMQGAYARISSHGKNATDVVQYGATSAILDTYMHMVCGKFQLASNNQYVSFIQFEGAPMSPGKSFTDSLVKGLLEEEKEKFLREFSDHTVDAMLYLNHVVAYNAAEYLKLRGVIPKPRNIALGTSEHTDMQPIWTQSLLFPPDRTQVTPVDIFATVRTNISNYDIREEDLLGDNRTRNALQEYLSQRRGNTTGVPIADLAPRNDTTTPYLDDGDWKQRERALQQLGQPKGNQATYWTLPSAATAIPGASLVPRLMGGKEKKKTNRRRRKSSRGGVRTFHKVRRHRRRTKKMI